MDKLSNLHKGNIFIVGFFLLEVVYRWVNDILATLKWGLKMPWGKIFRFKRTMNISDR